MYLFGKTDIGKKRATNQDNFRVLYPYENCCLCVICDCMGGANGGNIASEIAIKFFVNQVIARLEEYAQEDERLVLDPIREKDRIGAMLQSAVDRANEAVYRRSREDETLKGMGTTLVAALVIDRVAFLLNIGDSRLYQVTDRTIRQLTKDHSYLQYLIDSGKLRAEQAAGAPIRNIITRSIGTEEYVKGDLFLLRLQGEGFLLLCSDGLSGCVAEDAIHETVTAPCMISEDTDVNYELEDKATQLIALANDAGGADNITVILLKYGREDGNEVADE